MAGTLDALPRIRQYILSVAAPAGIASDRVYGLCLAVDEIATNIVVHGYQKHKMSGEITVRAELDDTELRIILEDTSPEFDARTLAAPRQEELDKPLAERKIGGLGVYLALQNIDRFDYARAGNFNRNIFALRRSE
jgi:anti-sigma regulatory factor (Ser/Thr protein kinase)